MKKITSEKLRELQIENKNILVDCYADWCGPCRALTPMLEKISSEYPNVEFVKINIDEDHETVMQFGITSIPMVIIFDGEEMIEMIKGANPEKIYREILDKL